MYRLLALFCGVGLLCSSCNDCQECKEEVKTYEVGLNGDSLVDQKSSQVMELCNEDLDAFSSEDSTVVVSGVFPGQTKTVTYFICKE